MSEVVLIDIDEWVEKARTDPVLYLERQATEIVLNTIGMSPEFSTSIFLNPHSPDSALFCGMGEPILI